MAFTYATENKISYNFIQETRMAGKDWLYGFTRRNPQVKLRQPEGVSLNGINAFNAEEAKIFFDYLEELM